VSGISFRVKVEKIRSEAIDILSFDLVDPEGLELPAFTPGAHIDVFVGQRLVRQYSLCGSPRARSRYTIAVKREADSRGGSDAMHQLRAGDLVLTGHPRNNFRLLSSSHKTLLYAGGIGITPLLSMARHLLDVKAPFELHYFARSQNHAAFHSVLAAPKFGDRVHFHYGLEADCVQRTICRTLPPRWSGAHIYVCGPKMFIDAIWAATTDWPRDSVHVEHFNATTPRSEASDDAFEVYLARRGESYQVPSGKSILQVLTDNSVDVDVSCEQGFCGTCVTRVLAGVPDHRDEYLTDQEKKACDKIAVCVSRAKTRSLVLDL
jgi:vanillate monooxygenase ferredoxin subunit